MRLWLHEWNVMFTQNQLVQYFELETWKDVHNLSFGNKRHPEKPLHQTIKKNSQMSPENPQYTTNAIPPAKHHGVVLKSLQTRDSFFCLLIKQRVGFLNRRLSYLSQKNSHGRSVIWEVTFCWVRCRVCGTGGGLRNFHSKVIWKQGPKSTKNNIIRAFWIRILFITMTSLSSSYYEFQEKYLPLPQGSAQGWIVHSFYFIV